MNAPPDFVSQQRSEEPRLNLSRATRYKIIERAFAALYRWYVDRSQRTRNWNADTSFAWRDFGRHHSLEVLRIIEGFFAVEQYVPDYTGRIVTLVRGSYGRSHFQLRWGAEEERHANTWENALFFSGHRSEPWIEEYKDQLRSREWRLPWEDALHMLVYTVFQERATELNYRNLGEIASRASDGVGLNRDQDATLARVAHTIAADEAAHYAFFLEGLRLYLYYFPEETLESILNVLKNFAMPAQDIIPNWDSVAEAIYRTGVYGQRQFGKNVMAVIFASLGIESRKKVEEGLKRSRTVPTNEGVIRQTSIWSSFDTNYVATQVRRLVMRVGSWESSIGRSQLTFVINPGAHP